MIRTSRCPATDTLYPSSHLPIFPRPLSRHTHTYTHTHTPTNFAGAWNNSPWLSPQILGRLGVLKAMVSAFGLTAEGGGGGLTAESVMQFLADANAHGT